MKWLMECVDRFWPDWLIVLWARGAMAIGGLFLILAVVMAVRHFGYGSPMLDSNSQEPVTPTRLIVWFLGFGAGGAFFLVLGILAHRWKSG